MSTPITIAIDGFSGCGKSSLARAMAQRLAYRYIDTGAMYRAVRSGTPLEVIENLNAIEDDEGETYESMEDVWPDYPRKDDFLFNEDEY